MLPYDVAIQPQPVAALKRFELVEVGDPFDCSHAVAVQWLSCVEQWVVQQPEAVIQRDCNRVEGEAR